MEGIVLGYADYAKVIVAATNTFIHRGEPLTVTLAEAIEDSTDVLTDGQLRVLGRQAAQGRANRSDGSSWELWERVLKAVNRETSARFEKGVRDQLRRDAQIELYDKVFAGASDSREKRRAQEVLGLRERNG